ncbi:MBL fold metallo-hydrolase [Sinomonas sp. ASV486]|uniref:MBL fold metallo-hydrolase n=1 Tax=Sinomonas sp. ASV486 TaxID=3051170 RepID=UPI0027DBFDF6|nr:MBL fold metallo-hydrolase [Sinomonas sp. ASV486]MDQ4490580.1 MBL fold metallo-hydrolase [Sinomonas sp. ASV486]
MKLTIVGCSGSFPGPSSPASCYLVTANDGERDWRILLDLGSGALGVLQRYLDLSDLDGVLLSHLHPDHCMDLTGLHVAVHWDPSGWTAGRVPVWGPAATKKRITTALDMQPEMDLDDDFEFHHWTAGEPIVFGPFRFEAYAARHPIAEAYALRIECSEPDGAGGLERRVLAYSGDTDTCQGLVDAAVDADLFLCEAAYHEGRDDAIEGVHLTGLRAGQAARDADAKRLLLTHLPVWNDPNRSVAEAQMAYEGPIAVAVAGVHYLV